MPNDGNAWNNEFHQRKCIDRGIDQLSLNKEDIITITDCDEIPNYKILSDLKKNGLGEEIYIMEMELYYYNLECRGKDYIWPLAKILKYQKYLDTKNPQYIRNNSNGIIKNGGWHFSYFGDVSFIKNKIQNFSHQEFNDDRFLDDELIKRQIHKCDDLFLRDNKNFHNFQKIKLEENENLPKNYKMLL